ncbi:MAG: BT_3928 family protein [Ferruginibacter sp.]
MMKIMVSAARIFTGLLFIFSGLVKAIDPLGLAYKMQEFFEAWADSGFVKTTMATLGNYALSFSVIMITLEVAVGVALLLGWQKKITTSILVLLMLFFTFLTSYVLFSGKIRACGCFGDCIPLTPIQTFIKDIILLALSLLLLVKRKYIFPVAKPWINTFYLLVCIIAVLVLHGYVLKHLPIKDCLPYKKGNNILALRKMPADAVPDKYDYVFVYEKAGEKKTFPVTALPDSTWKFSERKQQLVKAGKNNVPLINDFSLTAEDGTDATDSILNNPGEYYLFFIKEVPANTKEWLQAFKNMSSNAAAENKKIFIITSQRNAVKELFTKNNLPVNNIYTCDATAIKTAARTNPALYLMKGPVVQDKWSWADLEETN